jgi:hypothetical protein
MAAMTLIAVTAEVALVAATAKTVLQISAPTNIPLKLKSWGVSFDGTATTNEPVVVRLLRQTTAGTMTSLTLVKADSDRTGTIQTTATHSASAEPTAGDVLDRMDIHPQGGYVYVYAPDDCDIIPANTRLGIECTAPQAVNVIAKMRFEE